VTYPEARKLVLLAVLGLLLAALTLAAGDALTGRYELVTQSGGGAWSQGKKEPPLSQTPLLDRLHRLSGEGEEPPLPPVVRPHEWHALIYRLDRWTGRVVVVDEDLMMPVR
jgi:hypothetical protein